MNPHNMNYFFKDDLREHPEDNVDFKRGINYLIQKLKQEEDQIKKAQLLSSIGTHQRIAGFLEASLQNLMNARKLLEDSEKVRLYLINEIRTAHTFQFLKQFAEADSIYLRVETHIAQHPVHNNLLHFVYQHKGKNYFDQKKYQLAELYISKALALRKALDNAGFTESSKLALSVIQKK